MAIYVTLQRWVGFILSRACFDLWNNTEGIHRCVGMCRRGEYYWRRYMIIMLCILLPRVGLKQDQITVGMCGGMGKLVETASIANTFQASYPAFGLLCPAGAEKRPASQLHPTQGKPKYESSQHNYILQHMYTLTFSVFSTCSTIHLTDHFGSGILLRVSTLTQWSWNAATSLLPAQLLLCPICLHLLLYTVLLILWNNLCHMLEIT